MVQLGILTGKQAGNQMIVRRFPFRIGRAPGNHLRLDDDGKVKITFTKASIVRVLNDSSERASESK